MMLEKVEEYYKSELTTLKYIPDKEAKWSAVQRCLRVAQYAQILDPKIDYQKLETLFEHYKEKIMEDKTEN